MAAVAFFFASLATWSVDDPSLSNANSNIPQNAGGVIGSTVADHLMQFTGLPASSSWSCRQLAWLKIAQRPIHSIKSRLIAWLPATVLAAAALAASADPRHGPCRPDWAGCRRSCPQVPATLIGQYPSGLLAVPFIAVFGILALFMTLFAAGLIVRAPTPRPHLRPRDWRNPRRGRRRAGRALGALAHWYYLLKAQFRRKPSGRAPVRDNRAAVSGVPP